MGTSSWIRSDPLLARALAGPTFGVGSSKIRVDRSRGRVNHLTLSLHGELSEC